MKSTRLRINRFSAIDFLVVLTLLIAFYYNVYRYPLQINNTSTSPTYSETPLILKLGKYLVTLAVLLVVLVSKKAFTTRISKEHFWYGGSWLLLIAIPVAWGLVTRNFQFIETGFFLAPGFFFFLLSYRTYNFSSLARVLKYTVLIGIFFNLLQIALFLTIRRLPGLAYPDSFAVRFGSFLDDPNAFGILLALLLGFTMIYFRGWKKKGMLATLWLFLLLTQSLTALLAVPFAFVAYRGMLLLHFQRVRARSLVLVVFIAGTGLALIFAFLNQIIEVGTVIYLMKKGSIEDHYESFLRLFQISWVQLAGLRPANIFSETGYVNLIANFGLPYALLYVTMMGFAIRKLFIAYLSTTERNERSVIFASLIYLLAFSIGMLNLPLEQVFPVNVLTGLLAGMVLSGNLTHKAPPLPTPTAHQPSSYA